MPRQLVYFANPMCSWCWGFAPVVRHIRETYAGRVETVLALGALGDRTRPMREKDKEYVRGHWEHVHALTGQPFDQAFFDREGFVYDTERPSRAVAVVRERWPGLAIPFLERLHERFYACNEDITDAAVLADAAGEFGLAADEFAEAWGSEAMRALVAREVQEVAALGVAGYPTLLALGHGRPKVLALGCRPKDQVVAELDVWLEAGPAG